MTEELTVIITATLTLKYAFVNAFFIPPTYEIRVNRRSVVLLVKCCLKLLPQFSSHLNSTCYK